MPPGELRLGLAGRELTFDGNRPYCLVCGAKPFARRTLPFKDADYALKKSQNLNSILEWFNPALAYFNWRRKVAFSIDAPLCFRHFWRGLLGEFLVIGVFVAALAGLIVLWLKGKLPTGPSEAGALLKGGLIAIFLVGGWLISRRGPGKPVLPCDVKRDGDVRVILRYPDGAPTPGTK
jgi:hypothetical protein